MKRRSLGTTILFAATMCLPAWAQLREESLSQQGEGSRYVSQSWKIADGLPHNSVNAILQSRDGYLWLATNDGLARFDGVRFTVFGLRDGLPSLQVLSLLEDSAGALWIGTSLGLCRLKDGAFETWTTRDGLAGNEVTCLAEDAGKSIWAGSVTGLSKQAGNRFMSLGKAEGLEDKRVRFIAADMEGRVWISMFYQGLLQWTEGRFAAIPRAEGLSTAPPVCLMCDSKGSLWTGLAAGEVLTQAGGEWKAYGRQEGLPQSNVLQLLEASDGSIWACMGYGGLLRLERGRGSERWERVSTANEVVLCLEEDREHNFWVGTRSGGLLRLKPKRLSLIQIPMGDAQAVPRTLAEANDGTLWVGTSSRGIFRVRNGEVDASLRSPPMQNFPYVSAVLAVSDGSVWWGAGPALFQWKDGNLAQSYAKEFRSWLREDRIRALCEDRTGGGLWIGTQNGQLRLLRNGEFLTFTNAQPEAPVTALVQEPDGTLLVGTHGNGIIRVRDGKRLPTRAEESIRCLFVRALHRGKDGALWIGTDGAGLTRIHEGTALTLTTKNGLISDTIVQIVEGDDGHLWLGSYRGILRLSREEIHAFGAGKISFVHPLIFGRADGMPSEQCMRGFQAGLKSRTGLLYFSTDSGIVVVNPADQLTEASSPEVWLEKVVVDGTVVYSSVLSSKGSALTPTGETLNLPPGKRRLEFHYTGMNLAAPENVRFRYKLEGLDEQWYEAGRERIASYSLLAPGSYNFRVTACNSAGLWNPEGASVALKVAPYFWQTWWFRIGLFCMLTGSVISAVRFVSFRRLRLRLQLLEQEAAVHKDRARIAKDLHDDLGANVSQMAMLSELAQTDFDKHPVQAKDHIDQIFRTARSVTRSLDEIVWAVHPGNDTLDHFSAHICTFAPEFLRAAGISCRLDVPLELPKFTLPSNVRHHLYLALKEALHNVLKHAGATEVWLRLSIGTHELRLEVEDNGRGFKPAVEAAPGEDGLSNLHHRMNEISGRIEQKSEPGKGSSIVLFAPLQPIGL